MRRGLVIVLAGMLLAAGNDSRRPVPKSTAAPHTDASRGARFRSTRPSLPRRSAPGSGRRVAATRNVGPRTELLVSTTGEDPTDLLMWRPGSGTWYGVNSGPVNDASATLTKQWGDSSLGDIPVSGDMDGDGITDLITWRNSNGTWSWLKSSTGYSSPGATKQFGQSGDKPFVGDIDGDG